MSNEYKDYIYEEWMDKVYVYAYEKHKGQVRKYTNEPYINHPSNVRNIVRQVFRESISYNAYSIGELQTIEAIALLHDVVEDTNATIDEIEELFGTNIAKMVDSLTNVSKLSDGNRTIRKTIDTNHLLQTGNIISFIVKLADIYDNCKDIVDNDKSTFASKYLNEKKDFINTLKQFRNTKLENDLQNLKDIEQYLFKRDLIVLDNMITKVEQLLNQQLARIK